MKSLSKGRATWETTAGRSDRPAHAHRYERIVRAQTDWERNAAKRLPQLRWSYLGRLTCRSIQYCKNVCHHIKSAQALALRGHI